MVAASGHLSAGKTSEEKVVEMSPDGSQNRDVDEAAEIAQLIEQERPNLWTKRMFRLYGILLLGYMCIILQGYDGSLMGAINDMVCVPSFMRSFPIHAASHTNKVLHSLNIKNILECTSLLLLRPVLSF